MGLVHAEIELANAREDELLPMAVRAKFANRQCLVGALVLGNETLLGAIPMDMDVIIPPSRQSLTVNPNSLNIAVSLATGVLPERNR
jgi:hypothetical protein